MKLKELNAGDVFITEGSDFVYRVLGVCIYISSAAEKYGYTLEHFKPCYMVNDNQIYFLPNSLGVIKAKDMEFIVKT